MDYLLGYKKGMTQVYVEGAAVPVTVIKVPENVVTHVEKAGKDSKDVGHVELGVGSKKHANKSEKGKYKAAKLVPSQTWVVAFSDDAKIGDKFVAGELKVGDEVSITGTTKSKGFAGVIKRWGFHGGQRTHGQSDRERAPGSIGAGTDPGRVLPGRKMAGKMGGQTQTLTKRKIVDVGDDYVLVKGSVPGNSGSLLKIKVTKRNEG